MSPLFALPSGVSATFQAPGVGLSFKTLAQRTRERHQTAQCLRRGRPSSDVFRKRQNLIFAVASKPVFTEESDKAGREVIQKLLENGGVTAPRFDQEVQLISMDTKANGNNGSGRLHSSSSGAIKVKPYVPGSKPSDVAINPPFTYRDVRQAIPDHVFQPNVPKSLFFAVRDFVFVTALCVGVNFADQALMAAGLPLARLLLWPAYWFAQGTVFWALFVVGHDCGHGSFSKSTMLNEIVGTITHSFILVPYNSWRISHRRHHSNTGSVERDESWYPIAKTDYETMDPLSRFMRYELFLFLWPFYLLGARGRNSGGEKGTYGLSGSHFDPNCDLFKDNERSGVTVSSLSVVAMVGGLVAAGFKYGAGFMIANYWLPWVVFCIWLTLVTYLHHHDVSVPWYRIGDWHKLKGALSSIDRSYGKIIDHIHHDIGTHVVHHVFHQIPHYHLLEATEAVKPVLGEYYRKSDQGILAGLMDSKDKCRYVPDVGGAVHFNGHVDSDQ